MGPVGTPARSGPSAEDIDAGERTGRTPAIAASKPRPRIGGEGLPPQPVGANGSVYRLGVTASRGRPGRHGVAVLNHHLRSSGELACPGVDVVVVSANAARPLALQIDGAVEYVCDVRHDDTAFRIQRSKKSTH